MARSAMRGTLAAAILGLVSILTPAPAAAQCCGIICVDADRDGAVDDSIRCQPLVIQGTLDVLGASDGIAGCNDEHPSENLACVGGEILTGGTLLEGCACLLPGLGGDCVSGAGEPLSPAACAASAAAACDSARGAYKKIDDPACGACPGCGPAR